MLLQVAKYLFEGLAVALASHLVAGNKLDVKEIAMLGLTAAVVFMVLELYAPSVLAGARQGAGFGLGAKMVGGGEEAEESAPAPVPDDEPVSSAVPYKLVPGMYAHRVLLAGFNPDAKAANHDECDGMEL